MMDKYGTDAFRFTLAVFAAQGRDIIFSEKRIEGYRSFINKIWNATKFIFMNLGEDFRERDITPAELENFDRWILDTLNRTIEKVSDSLTDYKFNDAANAIYDFWWHEFCDWYLELTKQRLYSKNEEDRESSDTARQVLFHVLKKSLQLLHPFMPFITEELWESIKNESDDLIIVSKWPVVNEDFNFANEAAETGTFKELVYRVRNIRGEMNVPPDKKANVVFKTGNKNITELINRESVNMQALAKLDKIVVDPDYAPGSTDASAVIQDVEIYVPLKGIIDVEKEKDRLGKEILKIKSELERVENKLSNESFVSRAPANIIEKEKGRKEEYSEILSKLEASLSKLG